MTKYQVGADALSELNKEEGGGSNAEFTSFKSGTTLYVKALGTADLISFFSYGIYKQLNSFVAKEPSKKSANGFPVENLTPFDLAWKYHRDKSQEWTDAHGQEASKYRAKQRFAMGFFDLTSGEPIIIDVSKAQAQAIHSVIKKYEKRLGKLAFELSKTGQGTQTAVSLAPVLDFEEDLTDAQRANFDKAPAEFDMSLFDGLLFEVDNATQIQYLTQVGFDVSLIGLEKPADNAGSEVDPFAGIDDESLPF